MGKPRVCIVSPALAAANNGNWHTASRWQRFLSPLAEVQIVLAWQAEPVDAMIALHARRSADSIARFHAAHPRRPLALVLTGTDLYRDLGINHSARHSLQCASHLVVLQERALQSLDAVARAKARVIVQSATRLIRHDKAKGSFDFVAVGRALIADPDFVGRMERGEKVRTRCIQCNRCVAEMDRGGVRCVLDDPTRGVAA